MRVLEFWLMALWTSGVFFYATGWAKRDDRLYGFIGGVAFSITLFLMLTLLALKLGLVVI